YRHGPSLSNVTRRVPGGIGNTACQQSVGPGPARAPVRSGAGLDRAGLDTDTQLFDADPTGVDHRLEVLLRDRLRGEQDRGHRVATRRVELDHSLDVADGGAAGQGDCRLAGRGPEETGV